MARQRKTPLAWKNLTHDRRRLAVAVAGIAFAVLLMFTQVGFQNALFDSQVKVIDDLQGDIFLVSKAKFTLASEQRFPITRLYQALSCALALRPERRVILSDSGNFPTDLYMAQGLIETLGHSHELRLVAPGDVADSIDEDVAAEDAAGFHLDGGEACVALADADGGVESFAEDDRDAGFADEVVEDGFGDVGLEAPGFGLAVGGAESAVELAGHAADGGLVANVGRAEAAGG